MKKTFSLLLVLALCAGMLAGCGGDDSQSGSDSGADSSSSVSVAAYDVNTILATIESTVPVPEGKELDAETLSMLMGINMDNVEAFAAKMTQLNQTTDQIIVLQAKPGTVEDVMADLAAQQQAMVNSSSNYSEFAGEKVKAENARLVAHGDYVVLAILGDADAIQQPGGPDTVYAPVDEAIDKAFK